MGNDIFIRYKFNSQIKADEFKDELSKSYTVQTKPIYIPSATDGGEMWFQIFINVDFIDFIKGAVVGGLAWDLIKVGSKKYFLKPLIGAIDKLIAYNKEISRIDFKRIEFEYNDVTIRILGIKTSHTSKLSTIFSTLYKVVPKLERKGLGKLSDIVLPMVKTDSEFRKYQLVDEFHDLPLLEDYIKYWLVEFNFGLDRYIYEVEGDKIIE